VSGYDVGIYIVRIRGANLKDSQGMIARDYDSIFVEWLSIFDMGLPMGATLGSIVPSVVPPGKERHPYA
jgi:hypothetical protein